MTVVCGAGVVNLENNVSVLVSIFWGEFVMGVEKLLFLIKLLDINKRMDSLLNIKNYAVNQEWVCWRCVGGGGVMCVSV